MWQFFLGFSTGIYIGTYYDCKPIIGKLEFFIRQQCPPRKPGDNKKSEDD